MGQQSGRGYEEEKGKREKGRGLSEKGALEQGELEVILLCPSPQGKFPEGKRHHSHRLIQIYWHVKLYINSFAYLNSCILSPNYVKLQFKIYPETETNLYLAELSSPWLGN